VGRSYLETAAVIQKPVDAAAFPQDPQLYASAARTDIVYQARFMRACIRACAQYH
jgi:hypothetical protein